MKLDFGQEVSQRFFVTLEFWTNFHPKTRTNTCICSFDSFGLTLFVWQKMPQKPIFIYLHLTTSIFTRKYLPEMFFIKWTPGPREWGRPQPSLKKSTNF
jgi:hypothetical protein